MKKWAAVGAAILLGWSGLVSAADFNGDGRDDVGVFRPASGLWAVRGITRAYFGAAGDIPVPGDYNLNGRDDIAVFRPATGLWAVKGVTRAYFGTAGDRPFGGTGGRWTPRTGGIYYTGGQVSVGTTSPFPNDLFTVDGGRAYFANSNQHGIEIENSTWSALYIHNTPYRGIDISDCGQHGIQISNCGQNFIRAGQENGPTTFTVQSTGYVGIGVAPIGNTKLKIDGGTATWGARISTAGQNGTGLEARADTGATAYGVHGISSSGFAGYFDGKVQINGSLSVNGNLTKNSGSFRIDHPLDPANRYLSHSFVESPDMLNIYNGNAVLDENGEATVELPDYFEALNRDFRYQLTCLGSFAPVYVAKEISGNSFSIAGGTPGLKVSWQVTGVRNDPWAVGNPIIVEEDKPEEERGYYLHPEAYGQPESKSLAAARRSAKDSTTD